MAKKPTVQTLESEIHRLNGQLIAHQTVLASLLGNLGKAVPGAGSFVRAVIDDAGRTVRAMGGRAQGRPELDVRVTRALDTIQSMAESLGINEPPAEDLA